MGHLQDLANLFMRNEFNKIQPADMYFFDPVITIVLFRDRQYQVEQIIMPHGGYNVARHMHPDVDSIEIPFFGRPDTVMPTMRINNKRPIAQWLNDNQIYVEVPHGIYHGDSRNIAKSGIVFFSVQYWLNGILPTSIGLNWVGEYESEGHQKAVEQYNV